MKDMDLSEIERSAENTIKSYSELEMPNDHSKIQAIQLLSKEISVLSNEKKREFDEKMQSERFELDKDHKYWGEKFEEKKFSEEQSLAKERLNQESKRFELEDRKFKFEMFKFENEQKIAKENRKLDIIKLAITIGIPAAITIVELLVYRKLAYINYKLIYVDEGRPTTESKDAVKSIKNLIK